jgi:WD40 repeat protein
MNLTKVWAVQCDDYIIDLDWSKDGQFLAAGSASGPIEIFHATDGTKRLSATGHEQGTNTLRFSPDSHCLVSGGQDGKIKYWDPLAGQHITTVEMGKDWVEHLEFKPNSTLLAASCGKKLSLLKSDGSVSKALPDAPKTISSLAWDPQGGCLAVAYFGGITLWDSDDWIVQKELPYNNGINTLVWSPNSRWLVSGNADPSVHLWIPSEDAELHMSGYEGKVKHLSFDITSRWLATSGGRDACLWDCSGDGPEGREPNMLPHDAPICALAFQKSHGILATGAEDGTLELWSPERKNPLRATVKMPAAATKIAWSPNDTFLAIGSTQGIVYVLKCEA